MSIALIFDFDGTLVEVANSYYQTIIHTSYIYFEKIIGWKKLPELSSWFNIGHVNDLKSLDGFNNDYICTAAIILFLLQNSEILIDKNHSNLPLSPGIYREKVKKSPIELHFEWNSYITNLGHMKAGFFEEKCKNSKFGPMLYFTGSIYKKNYLERIFQEIYFGKEMFEHYYKESVKYALNKQYSEGLYKLEKKLISESILETLIEKKIPLGIVTGRPKEDLLLGIEFHNFSKYFDQHYINTLTDCIKNGNQGKPDPWGLLTVVKKMPKVNQYIFIGNSIDDKITAEKASIRFIGVSNKSEHWNEILSIIEEKLS